MSNTNPIATIEELHQCFVYDEVTGIAHWRTRPREHFPSERGWKVANAKFAGKVTGYRNRRGYMRVGITLRGHTRIYLLHRVIFAMMTGEWPDDPIDHINGNPSDNRFVNLRLAPDNINHKNRPIQKNNTTGYVGVYYDKRRDCYYPGVKADGKMLTGPYTKNKEWAKLLREYMNHRYEFHPNHGRKVSTMTTERRRQNEEDIAELIASAYRGSLDRDSFIEAMDGYGYLKNDKLEWNMLFALCNKVWHNGYTEGLDEEP